MSGFGPTGSLPTGSVHDLGTSPGPSAAPIDQATLSNRVNQAARQRYVATYKKRHRGPVARHRKISNWNNAINTAPVRVTWAGTEVANPGAAQVRVTWTGMEVPNTGLPLARVTWTGIEVATSITPAITLTYGKSKTPRATLNKKAKSLRDRRVRRKQFTLVVPTYPRVTWTGTEVANSGDVAARVTWVGTEISNTGDPYARVTWAGTEISNSGDPSARVTWTGVEVAISIATIDIPTKSRRVAVRFIGARKHHRVMRRKNKIAAVIAAQRSTRRRVLFTVT